MEYSEVINRIAYFRTKKDLSARELSILIGKGQNYINRLETEMFNVPTSVLLDIIGALEITPEEFFADDYMNYKSSTQLQKLISDLPPEKQNSLIDMIKKWA